MNPNCNPESSLPLFREFIKSGYLKGLQGSYKEIRKDSSMNLAGIVPLN